jgi:hypothetical protein
MTPTCQPKKAGDVAACTVVLAEAAISGLQ